MSVFRILSRCATISINLFVASCSFANFEKGRLIIGLWDNLSYNKVILFSERNFVIASISLVLRSIAKCNVASVTYAGVRHGRVDQVSLAYQTS
jgi:hypothetical protein